MDKINFEDGTLLKKGTVTIDGKTYEIEEPEYTGQTPISAHVLNKLQNNVENGIKDVLNLVVKEWNSNTVYNTLNQYVIHNEKIYTNLRAPTTKGEFKNNEWIEVNENLMTMLGKTKEESSDNEFSIIYLAGDYRYDKTKTYSVGSYCLHTLSDSKVYFLYRCTTAITTAEEWNREHWEQTNFIKELYKIMNLTEEVKTNRNLLLRTTEPLMTENGKYITTENGELILTAGF